MRGSVLVKTRPVVNYHGTLTDCHGLWVVYGTGSRLDLRDAWGRRLRCRTTSATPVTIPRITEPRARAIHTVRASRYGTIAPRIATWLRTNGLVEDADPESYPRGYALTPLGVTVQEALVWSKW